MRFRFALPRLPRNSFVVTGYHIEGRTLFVRVRSVVVDRAIAESEPLAVLSRLERTERP